MVLIPEGRALCNLEVYIQSEDISDCWFVAKHPKQNILFFHEGLFLLTQR